MSGSTPESRTRGAPRAWLTANIKRGLPRHCLPTYFRHSSLVPFVANRPSSESLASDSPEKPSMTDPITFVSIAKHVYCEPLWSTEFHPDESACRMRFEQ